MTTPLRLKASPAFVCARMPDGRTYVAQDVEPYAQYWLAERERVLLAAFSGRRGAEVDAALTQCGAPTATRRRAGWLRTVDGMVAAGVLVDTSAEGSRYERSIVEPYLMHRPFPEAITDEIARLGHMNRQSRVLDLAGGPGDLALQLAARGAQVTLMDWSGAFLSAARRRARNEGLPLKTIHDSCNRLLHSDSSYDVLTIAQALHWLDDVQVLRGVLRTLAEGGHFFVVHSAFDVPKRHPLAHVLGHDSILGTKARVDFGREVRALTDRLGALLFGLQSPGVGRVDPLRPDQSCSPLVPAAAMRFRQRRSLGFGFTRGLLTDRHLTQAGIDPAPFWRDAAARCATASRQQLLGTHEWALLHFRRVQDGGALGRRVGTPLIKISGLRDIGCSAPSEGPTSVPSVRYSQQE